MKILGAVLVVLACGGMGFIRTGRLSRQITHLDMLCMQVRFMQTELCQRGTSLPELFRQAEDVHLRQIAAELQNGKLLHEAAHSFLQHIIFPPPILYYMKRWRDWLKDKKRSPF